VDTVRHTRSPSCRFFATPSRPPCAFWHWLYRQRTPKSRRYCTPLFSKAAVSGYDTVYSTEGKPTKGDTKFTANRKGARWRFASAENRDKFLAAPDRYAPQYGGYCAWAVAQGYTASR